MTNPQLPPEVTTVRHLLESVRLIAQDAPACRSLLPKLDDLIGDVVFLEAIVEVEARWAVEDG